MRGCTITNGILEITDPFEYIQAQHKPVSVFNGNTSSDTYRVADTLYMTDRLGGHSRIFKGLQFDLNERKFLNAKAIRKLVPKAEVHKEYKQLCKELRKKVRGMINLNMFSQEMLDEHKYTHLGVPAYVFIEKALYEYSVENIAIVLSRFHLGWYVRNKNRFEVLDGALTKAISHYRDMWLETHDGFDKY